MDVRGGTRDVIQQCFLRHPVVTVRIVGRYVALVPKEQVDGCPGNVISTYRREQTVERPRRASAGQDKRASAMASHGVVHRGDRSFGRSPAELVHVGTDTYIRF